MHSKNTSITSIYNYEYLTLLQNCGKLPCGYCKAASFVFRLCEIETKFEIYKTSSRMHTNTVSVFCCLSIQEVVNEMSRTCYDRCDAVTSYGIQLYSCMQSASDTTVMHDS